LYVLYPMVILPMMCGTPNPQTTL